jgi:DNA-binding XRE family transcriptional regulator
MTRRYLKGLSKSQAPPRKPGTLRAVIAGTPQRDAVERLRAAAPGLVIAERTEETENADFVLMTMDEFTALEDAADERAAVAAYKATRDDEMIPHAIVKRLVSGENPIRVWRDHRGMSLDDLASATGKGKSFLSEIENGKKSGSIATLRAIAKALRVELADIAA